MVDAKSTKAAPVPKGPRSFMAYLVEEHIWIFMVFIIPISMMFDILDFLRLRINVLLSALGPSLGTHEDRVRKVQAQVRQWNEMKLDVPMCTARPGWKSVTLQKLSYKDRLYRVKVDLGSIISLDPVKKMVRVEPMVSIGQLNDYLISQGWTLPVVPELDDLTIGGLVMGGGIETTSHKYGLFQYICKAYESVLSDGSVVWCNKDENMELYSAIPFSYGTLGFLTAVDLDIIPYKPYLKMTYIPVHSLDSLVNTFATETNTPSVDSIEGIMYTLNDGVIMSGEFVDDYEPSKLNRMSLWYKPWFYKHVESFLFGKNREKLTERSIEYIPTKDFYHRHNRAWFWLMEHTISFANNPLFRLLLGWSMPPKFTLLKLLRQKVVPEEQVYNFVCQDFGFRLDQLKEALMFVDDETAIYPIWLCPARHVVIPGMEHMSIFKKDDVHVDIGIYGYSKIPGFDRIASQKRMERYAIDKKGYVALYAETQLTRKDFYDMFGFNLNNYDKLRTQMKCEKAFPHVYDKISKAARG